MFMRPVLMKAELCDFRTLLDIKKDIRHKFKLITVNCNVEDVKIVKTLILKHIVISMAEIMRCAILHYIFIEDLVLIEDSNYGKRKALTNRKTIIGLHISEELIELIKQKYSLETGYCTVIRQMLHAFIRKIKLKRR